MRHDKITYEQMYPAKLSPDCLVIILPIKKYPGLYLLNPHVKSTIHSVFATFKHQDKWSAHTVCLTYDLLRIESNGSLALIVQIFVVKLADTSPKCSLCCSGNDQLFYMANYCPFPVILDWLEKIFLYTRTDRPVTYAAAFFLSIFH